MERYRFLPVRNAFDSVVVPAFPFSFKYERADLEREFDQVQAVWAVNPDTYY